MTRYAVYVTHTVTGWIEVEASSKQAAVRALKDMEAVLGLNPVDISDAQTQVSIDYTLKHIHKVTCP